MAVLKLSKIMNHSAKLNIKLQKQNNLLATQNHKMLPDANAMETIKSKHLDIHVKTLANQMKANGCNSIAGKSCGRNNLFKYFRYRGWCTTNNEPTQLALNEKLLYPKESSYYNPKEKKYVTQITSLVTPKLQVKMLNQFCGTRFKLVQMPKLDNKIK